MEKIQNALKNKAFMYILLLLFCLFLACLSQNYDYDLFARLIVGESILDKGTFFYEDFLSYTPTHLWFDHEWGASVFFYAFFKYFGNYGLILIHALLMFGTVFFVIKTQELQKHSYPTSIFFITVFLLFFSHLNPHIVRCHMFSFMFFSLLLYILEKTRIKNSNIIWWTPLLILIWNNIHGGVVSGLGMIFIYLIGSKQWKKYLAVLLISLSLLVINPYGLDYLTFLISANTKTRTYVTEWWNVFALRHIYYYFPAFALILSILILCFQKTTKGLALLVTTILGCLHVKLLSLGLITAAALFYNDIIKYFNKNFVKTMNKITYILISLAILTIPFLEINTARVDMEKFPYKEVEFIKINNIKGNILTEFGLGSYVAYKLYPNNLIYMDGRYEEVYYDEELQAMLDYELVNRNWDDILYNYPTEILMPDKTVPVYNHLLKNKDWKLIYEGQVCGVFVRKDKVRKTYKQPDDRLNYYQKTAFDKIRVENND